MGLAYLSFLINLPAAFRYWFMAAGLVFIGGAIGVEGISGMIADIHGERNLGYALTVTVEELMEMIGIIIFINALLKYMVFSRVGITVDFIKPDGV